MSKIKLLIYPFSHIFTLEMKKQASISVSSDFVKRKLKKTIFFSTTSDLYFVQRPIYEESKTRMHVLLALQESIRDMQRSW